MTQSSPTVSIRMPLDVSLAGADTTTITRTLQSVGWVSDGSPRIKIDFKEHKKLSLDEALARGGYVQAYFGTSRLFVTTGKLVEADGLEVAVTVPKVLEALATIPFEVCAFGRAFRSRDMDPQTDAAYDAYSPPSFGDGHSKLGWGAAFKGGGHDRLVSRRWLEGGPFKVWRGPNDVSLVQFHALDADAATALEQAKPGHRQIGITEDTGFLQTDFVFTLDLDGLYDPATRAMKVVVLGREVANREMLEWAATRATGRGGPERPIERIVYVFPDEAEGVRALPRLWRYGHECWVIRDGVEVRLDATYAPPDTPPSWFR